MPGNNLTEALLALTRKQAEAIQELATSESKAAEGAGALNVKSAEFKETLGKLNELMPGLGDALIGAFNPEAIPLLALSAGIGLLIQQVNAYRKANEEAAEAAIALWQAQKQAVKDAAEDTDNYLAVLARIKAAREDLQAGEDLEMVRLKARAEEHQKILEYEEKRALLAAQGNPAKEAQIRNLFEGKKSDAALADERAELGQVQKDLEQARFSEGFARRNFDAAHGAVLSGPSPEAIEARSAAQSWLNQHADDLKTAETNAAGMSVAEARQNAKEAEDSGDPETFQAAIFMLAKAQSAEDELSRAKKKPRIIRPLLINTTRLKKPASKLNRTLPTP